MGVEPTLPASQAGVPTAYTTDTILIFGFYTYVSLPRPASSIEQLDQDSNPEHLVRSER